MADKEQTEAKEKKEKKKGGGKILKILMLVLLVIVLAGGGAAGSYYYFVVMKGNGAGGQSAAEPEPGGEPAVEAAEAHAPKAEAPSPKEEAASPKKEEASGGHGAKKEEKKEASGGHGAEGEGEGEGEGEATAEQDDLIMLPKRIDVNLRDTPRGGVMFELYVMAVDADAKKKLEEYTYPIRDALITLSSSKTRGDFETADGMVALKRDMKARIEEIVGEGTVHHVGFTSKVFFGVR